MSDTVYDVSTSFQTVIQNRTSVYIRSFQCQSPRTSPPSSWRTPRPPSCAWTRTTTAAARSRTTSSATSARTRPPGSRRPRTSCPRSSGTSSRTCSRPRPTSCASARRTRRGRASWRRSLPRWPRTAAWCRRRRPIRSRPRRPPFAGVRARARRFTAGRRSWRQLSSWLRWDWFPLALLCTAGRKVSTVRQPWTKLFLISLSHSLLFCLVNLAHFPVLQPPANISNNWRLRSSVHFKLT